MKFASSLVLSLCIPILVFGKPILKGTWKSNKELTWQTVYFHESIKEETKEKLRNLLGRMKITYTDDQIIQSMDGLEGEEDWEEVTPYTVVLSSERRLTIRWIEEDESQSKTVILNFVNPDRYWIAYPEGNGKFSGKEFFDRIKE